MQIFRKIILTLHLTDSMVGFDTPYIYNITNKQQDEKTTFIWRGSRAYIVVVGADQAPDRRTRRIPNPRRNLWPICRASRTLHLRRHLGGQKQQHSQPRRLPHRRVQRIERPPNPRIEVARRMFCRHLPLEGRRRPCLQASQNQECILGRHYGGQFFRHRRIFHALRTSRLQDIPLRERRLRHGEGHERLARIHHRH